ncbi:ABC-2 family transporter protein, partial [Brochothrix thermosphacta]
VFFLGYWIMFFDIFESDIFSLIDIFYVYSVVYVAFGLTQLIAGNLPNIATIIATGQLDIYLIKPRNSLLYMIMSKSSIVALGDIIYGLIALSVTLVKTSEYLFILLLYWLLLVVLVVTVIASYYIILG